MSHKCPPQIWNTWSHCLCTKKSGQSQTLLFCDFFKRDQISTLNHQHTTVAVTCFSNEMGFNFAFAWRQQEGHLPHWPFLIHSLTCLYLFHYCLGQHPLETMQKCGEIRHSFNSLSASDGGESLLFPLPTCQLRQMTAFGAWKHTLSPFLPLCSYRKKTNSQEMKWTKASGSAPQMCPPQLQKKYPPWTQCS